MNCSQHKKEVAGISDMKQLAEMIGDLHYETLAEFLNALAEKLHNDYVKDDEAGRTELAKCLLWTYYGIHKASYGGQPPSSPGSVKSAEEILGKYVHLPKPDMSGMQEINTNADNIIDAMERYASQFKDNGLREDANKYAEGFVEWVDEQMWSRKQNSDLWEELDLVALKYSETPITTAQLRILYDESLAEQK